MTAASNSGASASSAGPCAASGRHRPSRVSGLRLPCWRLRLLPPPGTTPAPDAKAFASTVWVCFRMGADWPDPYPVPPSLSKEYLSHPGRVGPALQHWSAPARASTPRHPSHSVRVGPAPGPPAWTGTGHGPAHPSCRTRWGERRRGAPQAGCPLHTPQPPRLRRRGFSARAGPACWPEHHRGRAAGRKFESTAILRGARCVASFVQIVPDCALNRATPRATAEITRIQNPSPPAAFLLVPHASSPAVPYPCRPPHHSLARLGHRPVSESLSHAPCREQGRGRKGETEEGWMEGIETYLFNASFR